MKRIRALDGPPPGLADYLKKAGDGANWDDFRSHKAGEADKAGEAYQELASALENIQKGLCGYCEINLLKDNKEFHNRQVEHFIPKSDGKDHELDPKNMMACCKGVSDENKKGAHSCGQAKADKKLPIDPRNLPELPSLMRVDFEGWIEADEAACSKCSIDVDHVKKTIKILRLNVDRLRHRRKERWRALSDNYGHLFNTEVIDTEVMQKAARVMKKAARMELLPGEDGRLPQFFTTSRSYFDRIAEEILAEAPQDWI